MTGAQRRIRSALELLLLCVFGVSIAAPGLCHLVWGGDGEGTKMEYRLPKPLPELRLSASFPREFEAYFNDNFALRTPMVRLHNRIKLLWLGTSPNPIFVVGRDGWLFFTGQRAIESHTGAVYLSDRDLGRWKRVAEERQAWLEEQGIRYMLVVVPDKHGIYSEKLPAAYYRPGVPSIYDQWMGFMKGNSSVDPVDPRPRLFEAKERGELLYYKYGTHWNLLGSWYGYEAIAERMKRLLPDFQPLERPEFFEGDDGRDDNFGKHLLIRDLMPQVVFMTRPEHPAEARLVAKKEAPPRVHIWETEDESRPRVLMFHDSHGNWLEPYLADSCERFVSILKGEFNRDLILKEKPDVVIDEYGERRLWRVPRR